MCYITQPRYIIETMLTTYHSSSPYTTLFRSQGDEQLTAFGLRLPVEQSRGGCLHRLGGNQTRVVRSTGGGSRQEVTGDRKSTRLNSSQVATSYDVFCLRK